MTTPTDRARRSRWSKSAIARAVALAQICIALTATLGCNRANDGPRQFAVSGKATYAGQPVPRGFIRFIPDASRGNSGPGGGAVIENGEFATEPGKGIVGGAYVVQMNGADGVPTTESGEELPDGKELFPLYETTVDFPSADVTRDFDVPKS